MMSARFRQVKAKPSPDKENSKAGKKAEVTANNTRRPAFKDVGNDVAKVTVRIKNTEKDVAAAAAAATVTVKPQDVNVNVRDIDTSRDPLLVSEYAKDIYKYLLELEEKYAIKEGYLASHPSTPKMRSILIDWIVEVHVQFKLTLETLHMTVAIIDRYLQENKTVGKDTLQLVGVSALLVACKYEEMYLPAISDFIYICEKAYTRKQILHTEQEILAKLDFNLGRPLSLHFLRRYSKAAQASAEQHTLAKYLLELALLNHNLSHVRPSIQAAAAICLSTGALSDLPDPTKAWSKTLTYYSGYKYADIRSTVVKLACVVGQAETSKCQAVQSKYAATRYNKISASRKLRGLLIRKLIASSPRET